MLELLVSVIGGRAPGPRRRVALAILGTVAFTGMMMVVNYGLLRIRRHSVPGTGPTDPVQPAAAWLFWLGLGQMALVTGLMVTLLATSPRAEASGPATGIRPLPWAVCALAAYSAAGAVAYLSSPDSAYRVRMLWLSAFLVALSTTVGLIHARRDPT